jgi:hypothetical protein
MGKLIDNRPEYVKNTFYGSEFNIYPTALVTRIGLERIPNANVDVITSFPRWQTEYPDLGAAEFRLAINFSYQGDIQKEALYKEIMADIDAAFGEIYIGKQSGTSRVIQIPSARLPLTNPASAEEKHKNAVNIFLKY